MIINIQGHTWRLKSLSCTKYNHDNWNTFIRTKSEEFAKSFSDNGEVSANITECLVKFWKNKGGLSEVCHYWQRSANNFKYFLVNKSVSIAENLLQSCRNQFILVRVVGSMRTWNSGLPTLVLSLQIRWYGTSDDINVD